MKTVLGVIGLCLGLAAAVLSFGEIGHLRQVAPGLLPGWTQGLSAGSGLSRGRAEIAPAGAPVGRMEVTWRWRGLAGAAPQWDVRLSAPGLDSSGVLTLPPPYAEVRLREGGGAADLAVTSGRVLSDPARGDLRLDDLTARFRLGDRRLVRLDGAGQIIGLHHDGVTLGSGTFELSADAGGGWRVAFDVSGPAVTAQGRLSGLIGAGFVTIDATVTEGEAMPQRLESRLNLMAQRSEPGVWTIRTRLP